MNKHEQYKALLAEADALAAKDNLTTEESARFDAAMAEADALKAEIDAETATAAAADRRARIDAAKAAPTRQRIVTDTDATGRISDMRLASEADKKLAGFAHKHEYFTAVYRAGLQGTSVDQRLFPLMASASGMNTTEGSAGGYLMPAAVIQATWDNMMNQPDNLVDRCDKAPVDGPILEMKGLSHDTTRAARLLFGGVRAYWLAEAAQITSSQPKFREITLKPKGIAGLAYMTGQMLQSASYLEQRVPAMLGTAINFEINDAIFEGTGSGQPLGFMNSPAKISVSKASGQAAATVKAENLLAMKARRLPKLAGQYVWLINQELEEVLPQMTINVGTGGMPVYLPSGGLSGSQYDTLFGMPVIPCEYCSALGTEGDIALVNLSAYLLGYATSGVEMAASMHLRFDYNEMAFRAIWAVDGQPWLDAPFTPFKATSGKTLSPFITLATRS